VSSSCFGFKLQNVRKCSKIVKKIVLKLQFKPGTNGKLATDGNFKEREE